MPLRRPQVLAPNVRELADTDTLFTGWLSSPQGRLTLTSGAPVLSATSVNAATSVIYTPSEGNMCPIWTGSVFAPILFSEVSQALSDTTYSPAAAVASMVYDYFAWGGYGSTTFRVTRGPAWSAGATAGSTTARGAGAGSTALARVNGLLVNQYAITNGPAAGFGTYLGSVMTDSSGATVTFDPISQAAGGGLCTIGLWNAYNRVTVTPVVQDTTATHTYSSATVRPFDNSTSNAILFVRGLASDWVTARFKTRLTMVSSSGSATVGIGLNSTSAFAATGTPAILGGGAQGVTASVTGQYDGLPGLGLNYLIALEQGDGTNANTYYGGSWQALTASLRY